MTENEWQEFINKEILKQYIPTKIGRVDFASGIDFIEDNLEKHPRVAELIREIEHACEYLESCGYGKRKIHNPESDQEMEPEHYMLKGFKEALKRFRGEK